MAPVTTLFQTVRVVATSPLITHGAMIVHTPTSGATQAMPCMRPYAEANPTASRARAMPTMRLFPVKLDIPLNPTTHGEIARYNPVRNVSPSIACANLVSAAASYLAELRDVGMHAHRLGSHVRHHLLHMVK